MLKKIIIGVITGIVLFFSGILVDRYYLVEPIEITDEKHEETKWQNSQLKQKIENKEELTTENNLVVNDCYLNPIFITGNTEGNYLYVTASDKCKSTKARYTIQATETGHHIIQAGIIFQWQYPKIGLMYELSYLYDFNFIAVGTGVIIDRYNPGIKLVVQKFF